MFSTIAVLLAIELARRTSGLTIPIMTVVAITYVAWWGKYASGMFHFPGLTWETVLYRSYYGLDGMFGPIAQISATYVYMFVLFGAFLLRSGAGDFVIDLARVAAGRFVGGPGQVAVLASGLMGSISGSSVANVVTTGVITIPLMKRAGFTPRFAAGVEAAASTGGPLMPPIMGAGVVHHVDLHPDLLPRDRRGVVPAGDPVLPLGRLLGAHRGAQEAASRRSGTTRPAWRRCCGPAAMRCCRSSC